MFKVEEIRRAAQERGGVEIKSSETWAALKEYADTIRANPWLSSPMMGGIIPAIGSPAMAQNGKGPEYLVGGIFDANRVAMEIEKALGHRGNLDMLDFGCGVARISRFLNVLWPRHNYLACEVNPDAVDFVNSSIPGIDAFLVNSQPPMDLPDESLDVVFAWSIWTHFDKKTSIAWLKEVERVLRPGGIALITVHNDEIVDRYGTEPDLMGRIKERGGNYAKIRKSYDKTGYAFWKAYEDEAGIDSETFGMVFTSRDWIRKNWGRTLDVMGYSVGVPGWQDLLTLQKPN